MPGYLYHLLFAQKVYERLTNYIQLDEINFFSGNLIPDLSKNKEKSHYRIVSSIPVLYVPDMKEVKLKMFNVRDSLKLGIYCHLFLDYYFIEKFLILQFDWDIENSTVKNLRKNKIWTMDEFFSDDGLYGSYNEINKLMIKNGDVDLEYIKSLPNILPKTDISFYDERYTEDWKEELKEYLDIDKQYTGDIIDYVLFQKFISKICNKFIYQVVDKL